MLLDDIAQNLLLFVFGGNGPDVLDVPELNSVLLGAALCVFLFQVGLIRLRDFDFAVFVELEDLLDVI